MFEHRCGFRSCSTPCVKVEGKIEAHWKCRVALHAFWCAVWIVLLVLVGMGWYSSFVDKADKKASPDEQFPNGIDLYYGIQWWGPGDVLHPVINNITGLGQGPSKFFNPLKPTVIYCHGWQNGGVTGNGLERLTSHTGVHMADMWIEQGWNVGSFYWTQFADEADVTVAEAKIWDTCLKPGLCFPSAPMDWKDKDGKSHPWKNGVGKSVGDLFYDSVVASLAAADVNPFESESNFSLRLVGHSLGGGAVVAAGYKLAAAAEAGTIPAFFKPDRIAMLDPFWSKSRESQVLTRGYELSHTHGVTVEVSRASDFSAPTRYGDLLKHQSIDDAWCTFSMVYPAFVDPLLSTMFSGPAEVLRHMAAKAIYFLSIDPRNPNAETGPSARTKNKVLKEFKKSGKFWKQVEGLYTETILDDKYEALSWSKEPPISGGTPDAWFLFFAGMTTGFLVLSSCVICCCCCYLHELVKFLKSRRQFADVDDFETAMVPAEDRRV